MTEAITSALHNHCTMCDGSNSLEEMITAAYNAGFTDFGMSCHGVTDFDIEYSLKDEDEYIKRVNEAKIKYASKLNIVLGIEQDYYAPVKNPDSFEYIIGSVHYIRDNNSGTYYSFDNTPQMLRECIDNMFSSDVFAMVQAYYDLVVKCVEKYRPTIVGHFDLVTKFNEDGAFFDENSPQYKNIALDALQRCSKYGSIFELNTGAMSRGWRTRPYPQLFILEQMNRLNIPVILSGDCHSCDSLRYGFDLGCRLLKDAGYTYILQYKNGKFEKTYI